jgi:hypothetical protein
LLAADVGVAAAYDGYLLLRRGEAERTPPDTFYSAWRASGVNLANSLGVQFGDALELVSFEILTDRYGEIVAEMVWLPLEPITRELRFYVAYTARDGSVLHHNDFYQPVSVLWYPTTMWEPGTPVRVRTLPWSLDTEQFVPLLGIYVGESWAEGEQFSVRSAESVTAPRPYPLLQGGKLLRLGGYLLDERWGWQPIPQPLLGDAPSPAMPLEVDFGGMIALVGIDLPAPQQGERVLPFTLHWQARSTIDFDYIAFAHLLDSGGNKVAQLDWQPHDHMGILPTSAWPIGWPVADAQELPLPNTLSAGDYTLIVGLYNWQSGSRLTAQGTAVIGGDAVQVGPVKIE